MCPTPQQGKDISAIGRSTSNARAQPLLVLLRIAAREAVANSREEAHRRPVLLWRAGNHIGRCHPRRRCCCLTASFTRHMLSQSIAAVHKLEVLCAAGLAACFGTGGIAAVASTAEDDCHAIQRAKRQGCTHLWWCRTCAAILDMQHGDEYYSACVVMVLPNCDGYVCLPRLVCSVHGHTWRVTLRATRTTTTMADHT